MTHFRVTVYPTEDVAKALNDGCSDFIGKPATPENKALIQERQLALWLILPQLLDITMEGDPCDG